MEAGLNSLTLDAALIVYHGGGKEHAHMQAHSGKPATEWAGQSWKELP